MPDPKTHPSPPDESSMILSGLNVLHRLHRAYRMSKIYELNNLIYRHQVDLLHHHLQRSFKDRDFVNLTLRESTLIFNNVKLKFGFSNYHLLKFARELLESFEIGEVAFASSLSKDELSAFVQCLSGKPQQNEDAHEFFLNSLRESGVGRITVHRIPPIEQSKDRERAAKKVYMLGITHLKEMFQDQEQKNISLITTKRLMQSIFNHITDNESFLVGLTNIKNFDEYTLNHSVNVCILAIALGKKLGLDRKELVDLGLSAFFHDFGKLDIPKEILLKPDRLSSEERTVIERHPQYGAEKLVHMREFSYLPLQALNVALEHHSGESSTGYPRYTRKKNIHLFSKIVKIVDVFDAITTKRPYRIKDFSREQALDMMQERSGTEFDPVILKIFVAMMGEFPIGTPVLLDSGEIGIVYENPMEPQNRHRPRIKLITDPDGNKLDGDVVDLTETDPQTKTYRRSVVKSLDPDYYRISVADYIVSEAV